MNKDIEKQLENYKYNKQSIPVLVYKVENIELKGNRYFKVFLVNNSKVYESLEIAFKINNYTYSVSSFSIIKEYKDPNIFGCVIKLEDDYKGVDYDIFYELKDGKKYIPTTPKKVETPKEEIKEEPIKVKNIETKVKEKQEKPKKVKKKNKSSRKGNKVLAILGIFVIVASLLCIYLMKVGEEKERKLREEIEEIREEATNIINWYGKYDEALVKYEEAFEKEKVLLNGQEIMNPNDFEKELNKINDPIEAYNFCINNNYVEIAKNYVDDCIVEHKAQQGTIIGDIYKFPDTDLEWTILDCVDNKLLIILNNSDIYMNYDTKYGSWDNSSIRNYLDDFIMNNKLNYHYERIEEFLTETSLNHIAIPSVDEYNKYKDVIPEVKETWWLRYGSDKFGYFPVVRDGDVLDETGEYGKDSIHLVRPIMWVKIY